MAEPDPRDPIVFLLLALTATTGLVDAVSILGLGRVFTANMTGNVVFLGFALGGVPEFSIARCSAALAAFLLGAAFGGYFGNTLAAAGHARWLTIISVIEAALLFAAALVASNGYDAEHLSPVTHLYAMIVLTGVAMGLRNATVRKLAVPDMTTTVLTLTLTGLAADWSLVGGANPRWGRRLGGVAAMFCGAVIGALLVTHFGLMAALLLAGLLVVAATVVFARTSSTKMVPGQSH